MTGFRYWLAAALGLGIAVVARADIYQRASKYYLDASQAEQVLASISVRPRLVDDEWLNILGDRRDETYRVRRGDTLWSISNQQLGDARLWRKLWQVNDFLSNPHQLEVGQILKYYHQGNEPVATGPVQGPMRIPLIRLIPGGSGTGIDLDNDNVFSKNLRNQFRPSLIIVTDREILGEISGAYTERESLGEHDELYLNFWLAESVKLGDRFAVARYEKLITDTTQMSRPVIGTLMRQVGVVTVRGFGETLVRGELTSVKSMIRRGDALVPLPPVVEWTAMFNPPPEFSAQIVTGDGEDRKVFMQGDIVLLNKGTSDGMKTGFLFRVYRDQDLKTGRADQVEPSYKGEVQILSTGEGASVAYVVRNTEPLLPGDTVVPTQSFLDPPAPPAREKVTIELE